MIANYIKDSLGKVGQVFTQRLTTVNWGKSSNIYSWIRSKDGYGGEATVLAIPLDHKPGIVFALTFIELMTKR